MLQRRINHTDDARSIAEPGIVTRGKHFMIIFKDSKEIDEYQLELKISRFLRFLVRFIQNFHRKFPIHGQFNFRISIFQPLFNSDTSCRKRLCLADQQYFSGPKKRIFQS